MRVGVLCFSCFIFLNVYVFLAGLAHHYAQAVSSCNKWGLLLVVVVRLLIAVGLCCCGARAVRHLAVSS